jgi:hypothetical protein
LKNNMDNLTCRFCSTPPDPAMTEMPCQNCGSDEMFRFIPEHLPKNYQEIKAALGIKDRQIAAVFGLAPHDFKTSSAKSRYKKAVERLYYIFQKI